LDDVIRLVFSRFLVGQCFVFVRVKRTANGFVYNADPAHFEAPLYLPHRQLHSVSPLRADLGVEGQFKALDYWQEVDKQVLVPILGGVGPLL
jgi:hypothetical protein